jgi:DNA-binding NarL/FixJ family response regulator
MNAIGGDTLAMLRRIAAERPTRIVVVASHLRDGDVLPLVECGVVGMVPLAAATPERLARSVRAAAGGCGEMPPTLLGQLLDQVAQLQRTCCAPRG